MNILNMYNLELSRLQQIQIFIELINWYVEIFIAHVLENYGYLYI
jgi:hypothetical protein